MCCDDHHCENACICCDDHYYENANSYCAMSDEANDCASEMKMSDPW